MLAQPVDAFGETGLLAAWGVVVAFFACPIVGLCLCAWRRGAAFAAKWSPVALVPGSLGVLAAVVSRVELLVCAGILVVPALWLMIGLSRSSSPTEHPAPPATRGS